MDAARPLVHGHVLGGEEGGRPIDPRMPGHQARQPGPGNAADDLGIGEAARLDRLVQPLPRQEEVPLSRPDDDVLLLGMDHDGQVGGQRPGSRGPNHHRHLPPGQGRIQGGRIRGQGESDIDGGGGIVLVLHLGLGQRGEAGGAPVDRLQPPVDPPGPDELPQLAQDGGLVGEDHRAIRIAPVPQAAQPLELFPLDVDELLGVGTAELPFLGDRDLLGLAAQLAIHLVLDGQAVAVPARHVGGVVAEHGAGLDDHVLQDLVQGVPHVDVAVGVGGAVVQDPAGPPGAGRADLLVEPGCLPHLEEFRLPLGEVGLHGEVGLGKVQRGLVIHRRAPLKKYQPSAGAPPSAISRRMAECRVQSQLGCKPTKESRPCQPSRAAPVLRLVRAGKTDRASRPPPGRPLALAWQAQPAPIG
jgi:hypothetical protein